MKNGPYSKKYGGSRSGSTKGAKDTLKVVGVAIISIATAILVVMSSKKK